MDDKAWIDDVFTSNFGWNVLEDLVEASPRMGGSPGEAEAHRRVERAFDEAGLRDIESREFDVAHWSRGDAGLVVESPRDATLDAIGLPGTPEADFEAPIVHLGYGLPEDFERRDVEDAIVVVRSDVPEWTDHWMHRREKYGLAKRHGAAGFVYANHVEGCLPPTGSLAGGIDVMGELPGVGVSKEVGERLRRYCDRGTVRGRLRVEAELGGTTSQNVTGVVGPETDDEILVCAHVDGHDIAEGATDNGAGVAILCDVARAVAGRGALDTRVRFVGFGCEEFGLVGSETWAREFDVGSVEAVLNFDGIGRGRDLRVHTNHFDGFDAAVDDVREEFGHPVEAVPEFVAHSDHWPFVCRGIPGAMVRSESGTRGRGFGHTYADTLDKVDLREIRQHAILGTRLVERAAAPETDFRRKSSETIRDMLEERDFREPLELAGDWPFED